MHKHKHKHVFFIRHGESGANVRNIYSPADIPLSKAGIVQAHKILERCQKLPYDVLITSDYIRAMQTAEHINEALKKELIVSDFFQEWNFPSELVGCEKEAPESIRIMEEIRLHADDPSWHYSDEENIFEFRERVHKALKFIAARPEQHVLVVTHSSFLKMVICHFLCDEPFSPELHYHMNKVLTSKNTGVTYARLAADNEWELVTWNNFSHLSHVA